MNKDQARALLALMADLYLIANQPDATFPVEAIPNGKVEQEKTKV